jgi:hypothetical protein
MKTKGRKKENTFTLTEEAVKWWEDALISLSFRDYRKHKGK